MSNTDVLTRQVRQLIAAGQDQDGRAEELCQQALAAEPDNADVMHLHGLIRYRAGDLPQAIRLIKHAIEREPKTPAFRRNLGEVLRSAGRADQAEQTLKEAIRLNPDYAEAWSQLGVVLTERRQFAAAERSLRRALKLKPNWPPALNRLGCVLRQQGRLVEAVEVYQQSLQQKPQSPATENDLAQLLFQLGDVDAARTSCLRALTGNPELTPSWTLLKQIVERQNQRDPQIGQLCAQTLAGDPQHSDALHVAALLKRATGQINAAIDFLDRSIAVTGDDPVRFRQRAELHQSADHPELALADRRRVVELQPENAAALNNLGECCVNCERYVEAETHLREVLRRKPDFPMALTNRGRALQKLSRLDEAVACHRRALELDPNCIFAWNNLGHALIESGEFDEAVRALTKVTDARPDMAQPLFGLSVVKSFEPNEEHIARARRLMDDDTQTVRLQSSAGFALGNMLDRVKRYDEAFPAYVRANQIRGTMFNVERHRGVVSRLMGLHTAEFQAAFPAGSPSERPVFVVGMPRSGTSLVEQILSAHPDIFGAGESSEMRKLCRGISSVTGIERDFPQCISDITPEHSGELARSYEEFLNSHDTAAKRVVNKTPEDFLFAGLIAGLFPNATLIHIRRHPLDTCLSCFFQNFADVPWSFRIPDTAHIYVQYRRIMEHWDRVLPGRILTIDYEELVANREAVSRRMIEHCGLEWDERCNEYHREDRTVQTASIWQARQPVYRSSVARWKRYEKHVMPFAAILGDIVPEQDVVESARRWQKRRLAAMTELNRQVHQATVLFDQGQVAETESICAKVLAIQPEHPGAMHLKGLVLMRRNQFAEAEPLIQKAIERNPNSPDMHHNLAEALRHQGREDEAEQSLNCAIALKPDFALAYDQLGKLQVAQSRLDEGEANICKAIELNPQNAAAHNSLGNCLLKRGRTGKAIASFQRSRTLDPHYTEALSSLGSAAYHSGEFEQAETLMRQAIQENPNLAAPWLTLSKMGSEIPVERLQSLSASPELGEQDRVTIGFALGHTLDRMGRYDEAFAAYDQANKRRRVTFDGDSHSKFVSSLIQTFTPGLFQRLAGFGSDSERPIFIVGMPRSGTTLVESIISSHPDVYGAGELATVEEVSRKVNPVPNSKHPYPLAMKHLSAASIANLAQHYLDEIAGFDADAVRVTDKMPTNFVHLGLLGALFPKATFIHCRRHVLDTCVSCYFQSFTSVPYSFDLTLLGQFYRDYLRLMDHWRNAVPVDLLEIDYENTVMDQEGVTRRLIEHCGLEWDDRCLSYHTEKRTVRTASAWQARQPVYTTSVARWKRYEKNLGPLLGALGDACPSIP